MMIPQWLIVLYFATGYVMAFDWCCNEESAGRKLNLIETAISAILWSVLWLPLIILATYFFAIRIIYKKLKGDK